MTCAVEMCSYTVMARGLCSTHYKRDLRSRKSQGKQSLCHECGKPTGSPKLTVWYCPEHDAIARFHNSLTQHEARKAETRRRWAQARFDAQERHRQWLADRAQALAERRAARDEFRSWVDRRYTLEKKKERRRRQDRKILLSLVRYHDRKLWIGRRFATLAAQSEAAFAARLTRATKWHPEIATVAKDARAGDQNSRLLAELILEQMEDDTPFAKQSRGDLPLPGWLTEDWE